MTGGNNEEKERGQWRKTGNKKKKEKKSEKADMKQK